VDSFSRYFTISDEYLNLSLFVKSLSFSLLYHDFMHIYYTGDGTIPGVLDISIPSFVLRSSGSNTHFQYEVFIVTPYERWSVLRRYQRFRDLYNYMRKKYGAKVSFYLKTI